MFLVREQVLLRKVACVWIHLAYFLQFFDQFKRKLSNSTQLLAIHNVSAWVGRNNGGLVIACTLIPMHLLLVLRVRFPTLALDL